MKNNKKILIQGIHIPFSCEKDGIWMTPCWVDVFDYYPTYFKEASNNNLTMPLNFYGYVLEVCNEIDKKGLREEYNKKQLLQRCYEHYGSFFIMNYIKKYKNLAGNSNGNN